MPASVAIHPAWRPITSQTITRWCDSAVVPRRSIASVAVWTAVWKPKVTSVPERSLSIVFGTPDRRDPHAHSWLATPRVSSPPIATRASTPAGSEVLDDPLGPLILGERVGARGAEHGAAQGEQAGRLDRVERPRPVLEHAAPAVEVAEGLVPVADLPGDHDRPDDRVQARDSHRPR